MNDFNLISTTTQLLVLKEKVDSLESHMNWVISGVTITIGVLMAIFAVIQFVYQRKIEKGEIRELEDNLKKKVSDDLLEKEKNLKDFVEFKINIVERDLRNQISYMSADVARQFAIGCEGKNIPATEFSWWLNAAASYSENSSNELCIICIQNAKVALRKVKSSFDVDSLLKYSATITEHLTKLAENHKTESDLLSELFKEKIRLDPSIQTVSNIPG